MGTPRSGPLPAPQGRCGRGTKHLWPTPAPRAMQAHPPAGVRGPPDTTPHLGGPRGAPSGRGDGGSASILPLGRGDGGSASIPPLRASRGARKALPASRCSRRVLDRKVLTGRAPPPRGAPDQLAPAERFPRGGAPDQPAPAEYSMVRRPGQGADHGACPRNRPGALPRTLGSEGARPRTAPGEGGPSSPSRARSPRGARRGRGVRRDRPRRTATGAARHGPGERWRALRRAPAQGLGEPTLRAGPRRGPLRARS